MDRRKALKNIGLTTGFVVATPSLLSLLQSCKSDPVGWTPAFLSVDEGVVLKSIVDVFLPKTDDSPSATEVNVPEFIDKYVQEVPDLEDQAKYKEQFGLLVTKLKTDYNENLNKVTVENYQELLDNYLGAEKEGTDKDIAGLLNELKWATINAYRNSEMVGEQVLAYDPVPGGYIGCGSLQELTGGRSWSL